MNVHDLIDYGPAHCDTCKKEMDREFCCDDLCVECEAEFLRNNPDEIPFLLTQIKRDPSKFAPWQAAIDLLGDEAELLTFIGRCQTGDLIVNQNTISGLLKTAYSLGKFHSALNSVRAAA